MRACRVGQILPSSSITMNTEIPAMLRGRETIRPGQFAFHSSRMRMKRVTQEELAAKDRDSLRCARESGCGMYRPVSQVRPNETIS